MESRKMVLMNLFAEKEWRCRYREQSCRHSGRRKEWDKWRKQHQHMYTSMCKTGSWLEAAIEHRKPSLALCDDLERWDTEREGDSRRK